MTDFGLPIVPENKERYRRFYLSIVRKFKTKQMDSGVFYEIHHILPKCMGGSNDEENLVSVPIKIHIILHYLLVEMFEDNYKLGFALRLMTKGVNRKEVINKYFSINAATKLREAYIRSIKNYDNSGKNNPRSKSIISPEGVIYGSIREAGRYIGKNESTIRGWLKNPKNSWNYLIKAPTTMCEEGITTPKDIV